MLSLPGSYLRLLVHERPLASVAVSGDRHSVSYSPLGSARSGPAPNLLSQKLQAVTSEAVPGSADPTSSSTPASVYKKHAPEPCVRYLHRCHTKVPPLHPKRWTFRSPVPRPVPRGPEGVGIAPLLAGHVNA
jgi:hypothetical protein